MLATAGRRVARGTARRESRLTMIAGQGGLEADARWPPSSRRRRRRPGGRAGPARGVGQGPAATVPTEQAQPAPTAHPPTESRSEGRRDEGLRAAYNAQVVVDGPRSHCRLCADAEATDVGQFLPLVAQIELHTGQRPTVVLADAGYFSEHTSRRRRCGDDVYVPPDRSPPPRWPWGSRPARGKVPSRPPCVSAWTAAGRAAYALRRASSTRVRADQRDPPLPPVCCAGRRQGQSRVAADLPDPHLLKLFRSACSRRRDGPATSPPYYRPDLHPRWLPAALPSSFARSHRTRIDERVLLLR